MQESSQIQTEAFDPIEWINENKHQINRGCKDDVNFLPRRLNNKKKTQADKYVANVEKDATIILATTHAKYADYEQVSHHNVFYLAAPSLHRKKSRDLKNQ